MSFPLGSLGAQGASLAHGAAAPGSRWRLQLGVLFGGVAWLLALLALVTHSAAEPAWWTSGLGPDVANRVGILGAWFSDLVLFLFGHSAWWGLLIGARIWLGALAQLLGVQRPWLGGRPAADILANAADWQRILEVTRAAARRGESANHEVMLRAPESGAGGRGVWSQLTPRMVGAEGEADAMILLRIPHKRACI